jgi:hypothetical protein
MGLRPSFPVVSKAWLLILHNLHDLRTILIVIFNVIGPDAHWIASLGFPPARGIALSYSAIALLVLPSLLRK